jgi:hypothetical protein
MPAPKGQRDATRIRTIARAIRDYAAKATTFEMKWVYDRASEIEDLATDMNAATGRRDRAKKKSARRAPAKRKSATRRKK